MPLLLLPALPHRFHPVSPFIFLYQRCPRHPRLSCGCGSLYTRSVAVLNVLSLLMPRSGLPSRSNHEHFCPPPSFSWPDIELYATRIYRSKSFRGEVRGVRCRRKREEKRRKEQYRDRTIYAKKFKEDREKEMAHLYKLTETFGLLLRPVYRAFVCFFTKMLKKPNAIKRLFFC